MDWGANSPCLAVSCWMLCMNACASITSSPHGMLAQSKLPRTRPLGMSLACSGELEEGEALGRNFPFFFGDGIVGHYQDSGLKQVLEYDGGSRIYYPSLLLAHYALELRIGASTIDCQRS